MSDTTALCGVVGFGLLGLVYALWMWRLDRRARKR
jgi:hypothetical protein